MHFGFKNHYNLHKYLTVSCEERTGVVVITHSCKIYDSSWLQLPVISQLSNKWFWSIIGILITGRGITMYIQLQILLYIANKVAIFSATTLAVYSFSLLFYGDGKVGGCGTQPTKHARFQWRLYSSLVVIACACQTQGKGYPDVGTRLLLRRLWEQFKLPIFTLVDADPHGMHAKSIM